MAGDTSPIIHIIDIHIVWDPIPACPTPRTSLLTRGISAHCTASIKPRVTFNVNEQLFAIGFKFKVLNKSWSHQSRR